jgi:ribosome-interacting GTPase 1
MPANLPPAYRDAEARLRAARGTEEKIAALEEMLAVMPKHKGTDKLQADLRARIAKLRREPARKGAARAHTHLVPREGAGQVVLAGPPNSGKSSLLAALTHAHPEIAAHPFTTREPAPGMMPFEDVAIQLVDLPPLAEERVEPWVFDLVRRADLVWAVLEGTSSLDGLDLVRKVLAGRRLGLAPAGAGTEPAAPAGMVLRPALLVLTGADRPGAAGDAAALADLLDEPWPILSVSAVTGEGLEALRLRTFRALGVVRVYTKQPGKPADRSRPFTLKAGATVGDLALAIHKDLHEKLRYARVWGGAAFDGQTVQRDHALTDGDVVEIHV